MPSRLVTLTPDQQTALLAHLRVTLAPVLRSDWGEGDVLVLLLRRLEAAS